MIDTLRGETTIKGPGGEEFTLCLTLGAVAEIEDQIDDIDSLADVSIVLEKGRMRDMCTILLALLHGGGNVVERNDLMNWPLNMVELGKSISSAFAEQGLSDDEEEDTPEREEAYDLGGDELQLPKKQ